MTKTLKNILIIIAGIIILVLVWNFHKTPKLNVDEPQNTMPVLTDKTDILGNKDDLISFSIVPGARVHGIKSYRGTLQNSYFFEANVRINILDANKKVLKQSNAVATTDWMTSGPVDFEGNIDFTGLPTGAAYFEIQNDNPSGIPANDKSILIPIIIEVSSTSMSTHLYANHGFTMELPAGFTPNEMQSEGGPAITISLPNNSNLSYVTNATFWEQYNLPNYHYVKDEKIGTTTFKVYTYEGTTFYWFKQGNVGYEFFGDKNLLVTFKFVGWK